MDLRKGRVPRKEQLVLQKKKKFKFKAKIVYVLFTILRCMETYRLGNVPWEICKYVGKRTRSLVPPTGVSIPSATSDLFKEP